MCRSSDPPDPASARLRRECESLRAEAKLFREQLRKAIREVRAAREQRSAGPRPHRPGEHEESAEPVT
jgi:hypothetical protein